jgi:hypothetical protein
MVLRTNKAIQTLTLSKGRLTADQSAMTFLLFLASLMVLEFIVRRSSATPGKTNDQAPPQAVKRRDVNSEPGLMALAHAVEQQGTGQLVDPTGQGGAVHQSEVDRV